MHITHIIHHFYTILKKNTDKHEYYKCTANMQICYISTEFEKKKKYIIKPTVLIYLTMKYGYAYITVMNICNFCFVFTFVFLL